MTCLKSTIKKNYKSKKRFTWYNFDKYLSLGVVMFFRFLLVLAVVFGVSFSGCGSSSSSGGDGVGGKEVSQQKLKEDGGLVSYDYNSTQAEDGNYKEITLTKEFKIPSDAVFIDVRNSWERSLSAGYPAGSIGGDVVYEWRTPNADRTGEKVPKERNKNGNFINDVLAKIDKDNTKHIILICHSGSRTKKAAKLLADNNFTNVEHIKGGFNSWNANDLPVEHDN